MRKNKYKPITKIPGTINSSKPNIVCSKVSTNGYILNNVSYNSIKYVLSKFMVLSWSSY